MRNPISEWINQIAAFYGAPRETLTLGDVERLQSTRPMIRQMPRRLPLPRVRPAFISDGSRRIA